MTSSSITMVAAAGPLSGFQSALNPAGPGARQIAHLWLMILGICIVVFILVWAALLRAIAIRGRTAELPPEPILDTEAVDRKAKVIISGAVAVTVITLFVVLFSSVLAGKNVTQGLSSKEPVTI